jgi:hypothetical protein
LSSIVWSDGPQHKTHSSNTWTSKSSKSGKNLNEMTEIIPDKAKSSHVELEHTLSRDGLAKVDTMGTVKLTDGVVVYIPTPTADPQDPLNMPIWQKWVVMVIISICKSQWAGGNTNSEL